MKNIGLGFIPEEIIFCPTSKCNLKCAHCFVERNNNMLDIQKSISLLHSCKDNISKVGFSGGEPFLNPNFLFELSKETVKLDLMFDRLMTNGTWWHTQEELEDNLIKLRDSGFDGTIGISWDKFHGQQEEKIFAFINTCYNIFSRNDFIEILSVIDEADSKNDNKVFLEKLSSLQEKLDLKCIEKKLVKKSGAGQVCIHNTNFDKYINIYRFKQSHLPEESMQLNDKKWFTEDYCQSTGNVFYVHANGNIAPCCGFANECPQLFIGTVEDNYDTLIENATKNRVVNLCYNKGLLQHAKYLQKQKILPKGKCDDMCALCAWICKYQ